MLIMVFLLLTVFTSTFIGVLTVPAEPKQGCPLPPIPIGGVYTVSNSKREVVPGEVVSHFTYLTYSCRPGYQVTKPHLAECQEDNSWSASPVCNSLVAQQTGSEARGCPLPAIPANGHYILAQHPNRRVVPGELAAQYDFLLYTCDAGYEPNAENPHCLSNNTWKTLPVCSKRCTVSPGFTVDTVCSPVVYAVTWDPCPLYIPDGTYVRSICKYGFTPLEQAGNKIVRCENGVLGKRPKCKPDCGLEKSFSVNHIVKAPTVEENTFPWHVGIYQKSYRQNGEIYYDQICGGSILYSFMIISAAHCFWDVSKEKAFPPDLYNVAAGKFLRAWDREKVTVTGVQKREVYEIRLHEDYAGAKTNQGSDMAILVLWEALEFTPSVRAVCYDIVSDTFNRNQILDGNLGKVAGWGVDESGASSETLRSISLPVISKAVCKAEFDKYQYGGYLTLDKLCAGYTNGTAVCKGDSGGGLVFPYEDAMAGVKRWYLRGIVSHGPLAEDRQSCRANTYTVFAVFYSMRDWFRRELQTLM